MSLIIAYPPGSPTHTATLNSPELGDAEADIFKTNIHQAMDAGVTATRRTPSIQKLLWAFRNIPTDCDDQLTDLEAVLTEAKGRDVLVTDHNSDEWTGKIITNPLDIKHTAVGRCDFALEFIGTKDGST